LPQGHPNGYPIYRQEWQSVGSLQRRLRNCLFGQRAELYAFGSSDLMAGLFLINRRADDDKT
jgi:sulfur-oxidizing protein SoxA